MTTGSSRRSMAPLQGKKKTGENEVGPADSVSRKSFPLTRSIGPTGERTVKRLRLSKALTVPETTSVYEACRRMAARRVDALLLIDSNALLCGILTDKDVATRVIAHKLNVKKETPVSKVMTRNPVFVLSDTLSVEALQKMVQGKFRHLPVVENGEVIALLDIAKCLYDAISRLERASEKGKAIVDAVEGVEKHWGASVSGNTFIETLRERMFRPSLRTIIPENSKIVTVAPSETVVDAALKMLESGLSSAVVTVDRKPLGILTSKDILMRVIAPDLAPESTAVEKVMTPNPECASVDTSIVDALHIMHDGKFLHLPVVDTDGAVVSVVDVLHITHAAITTVGNTADVNNEATNSMMQKFWDSAMELAPGDDEETRSDSSLKMASEGTETGRALPVPSSNLPTTFAFKIQDRKGGMHRFTCETRSMMDVITAVLQRVGDDIDRNKLPQILYEDEDHDRVILASDSDLAAAVEHARSAGWKGLRLHLDYSETQSSGSSSTGYGLADSWTSAYNAVAAGAALAAGLGLFAFLRRSGN